MKGRKILCALLFAVLLVSLFACKNEDGAQAVIDGKFKIICFSAGKADAFLLTTENSAVIIDTGEKSFAKTFVNYMTEQGINKIDYLIISHFDKDHVGGAAGIIGSTEIQNVLQSNYGKDSSQYEKYVSALSEKSLEPVTVRETYTFSLDGAEYTVYPPLKEEYENDPSNNSSLIVSVKYGEKTFLFSGDAENERLYEFADMNNNDYDFLKVPYHGHYQENLESFLASVKANYAVITSSDEEPEDDKTVSLLQKYGAKVYLTRSGDVTVLCDGENISVLQQEGAA